MASVFWRRSLPFSLLLAIRASLCVREDRAHHISSASQSEVNEKAAYLFTQAHVELCLEAITLARQASPESFAMALLQLVDQVCADGLFRVRLEMLATREKGQDQTVC
jgi:hypothetical protein